MCTVRVTRRYSDKAKCHRVVMQGQSAGCQGYSDMGYRDAIDSQNVSGVHVWTADLTRDC